MADNPRPPDIGPLLRERLIATGVDPDLADELLDFAKREGQRLREEREARDGR